MKTEVSLQHKFTQNIKGKQVTFEVMPYHDAVDFSSITSVSVIAFNKEEEILSVMLEHRGVDIPGGHVEPHETNIYETIKREAMEEACVSLKDIQPIALIKSDYNPEKETYMVIMAGRVDEEYPFKAEYESTQRLYLNVDSFLNVYKNFDLEVMKNLINKALDII